MFESRTTKILLATCFALAPLMVSLSITPCDAQSSSPPSRPKRDADPEEFYRAPSSMNGKTVLVPIGTTWEGRIDKTISSVRSRPGTAFNIVMSSPVLLNGTDVVVPAGSAIVGEVVEAVPASQVPKRYREVKKFVRGKLRVQISGLRTPDGVVHPLVADVAGEYDPSPTKYRDRGQTPRGTGIAYMGSSSSFEAVNINRMRKQRSTSGDKRPAVVKKKELLADEILGTGEDGYKRDELLIRSLILKGRDYWIYDGSPLTVRLKAPFKIGVVAPTIGGPVSSEVPIEDTLPPPTRAAAGRGGGYATESGGGGYAQPTVAPPAIPADSF